MNSGSKLTLHLYFSKNRRR